ncbi:hypothetical protein FACS189440_10520 [Bacteroidia bacterium]|nr:hypothetical protein FACS189440_10520 [Bacteroidia bacterium]
MNGNGIVICNVLYHEYYFFGNYIYQESGNDFSIVHRLDGYDEISLTDTFKIINKKEYLFNPFVSKKLYCIFVKTIK